MEHAHAETTTPTTAAVRRERRTPVRVVRGRRVWPAASSM